ncbi:MAG: glycoside hydrolase family 20 zincin-like fold domain-containing protein [Clostridia bacterium]
MNYLPTPLNEQPLEGSFSIGLQTRIVLHAQTGELAKTGAKQLKEELHRFAGFEVPILRGEALNGDIALQLASGLPAQGYRLRVDPQGVTVAGADEAGLLHGVQTLRQLIRKSGCELSALQIDDAPKLLDRGYYLDVTRGRIPKLSALKALADSLCFYKLNQLQLYIEHTYLYRELTELYRLGDALTAEDIMELDDYCAARGIELVPSFSSFGHLFELLSTKGYASLCELTAAAPSTMPNRMRHHTLNISDERALPLMRAMIAEVMPLFRSRRFNICADETFDLGKERSREELARVGERAYYMGFVKELCAFVAEKGHQPMFWGDIVQRFPDALAELPQGTICLNWGYSPEEKEDATRRLAQAGALQYVCPGVNGWNQWMPPLRDGYENIRRMAAYGKKHGAIGLLNTDWGDYGHINDTLFSLPGLVYGAVFAWCDADASFDELNAAISRVEYLDQSGKVVGLLAQMQAAYACKWYSLVHFKDFAQGNLEVGFDELAGCTDEQAARCNAHLADVMAALRACTPAMDSSTRGMLQAWVVAGEAIRLWNLVGAAVAAGREDAALAAALERWFESYKQLWRATCRESELSRLLDVVTWYAQLLRQGKQG